MGQSLLLLQPVAARVRKGVRSSKVTCRQPTHPPLFLETWNRPLPTSSRKEQLGLVLPYLINTYLFFLPHRSSFLPFSSSSYFILPPLPERVVAPNSPLAPGMTGQYQIHTQAAKRGGGERKAGLTLPEKLPQATHLASWEFARFPLPPSLIHPAQLRPRHMIAEGREGRLWNWLSNDVRGYLQRNVRPFLFCLKGTARFGLFCLHPLKGLPRRLTISTIGLASSDDDY